MIDGFENDGSHWAFNIALSSIIVAAREEDVIPGKKTRVGFIGLGLFLRIRMGAATVGDLVVDQLVDLLPGPDEFAPWAQRTEVLAEARNKQKASRRWTTRIIEHHSQKFFERRARARFLNFGV